MNEVGGVGSEGNPNLWQLDNIVSKHDFYKLLLTSILRSSVQQIHWIPLLRSKKISRTSHDESVLIGR